MYKTYTKYIKIYESTTPQPHIISLLAVPGQYLQGKPQGAGRSPRGSGGVIRGYLEVSPG